MLLSLVMIAGGGVLLYFGAEWLVGGASGFARSLGVPQLLIGLTVVAWGTSAPEVVVGVKASLAGSGAIALGNVIGSNIANIGLILGLTVLVKPPRADASLQSRELPLLVLSAVFLPVVLFDGVVSRLEGAALVGCALAYTAVMIRSARRSDVAAAAREAAVMSEAADDAGAPAPGRRGRQGLVALGGLGALVAGGSLFVDGASALALALGLSERLVGLTIVAVGTSLPELATSLIAAGRGHSDIAVGNVVGSNIFNVLLCLGLAALAAPITQPLQVAALDLGVMGLLTVLAVVMLRRARTLARIEGAVLVMVYGGYLAMLAS